MASKTMISEGNNGPRTVVGFPAATGGNPFAGGPNDPARLHHDRREARRLAYIEEHGPETGTGPDSFEDAMASTKPAPKRAAKKRKAAKRKTRVVHRRELAALTAPATRRSPKARRARPDADGAPTVRLPPKSARADLARRYFAMGRVELEELAGRGDTLARGELARRGGKSKKGGSKVAAKPRKAKGSKVKAKRAAKPKKARKVARKASKAKRPAKKARKARRA